MSDITPLQGTSPVQPGQPSPPSGQPARTPVPPRKRRWLRRFVVLIVLLVMLVGAFVALAPAIVSSTTGTGFLISAANGMLRGQIDLDDLSLSWGGPTEIRGLVVTDPAQQEVLRVARVSMPSGAWRLATSPMAFGEITIDEPQAVLYLKPEGGVTIADAFQLRQPGPEKPAGPLPEIRGSLRLANGTVRVVRPDGAAIQADDITLDVDLDTLNQIQARLNLALPDSTKLAGQADLRQITPDGQLDVRNATGTVRLTTDRRMDVQPIAEFAAGKQGASGSASFDLDGSIEPGKVHLVLNADADQFQFAGRTRTDVKPISARLSTTADYTPEQLAVFLAAEGEPGTVEADLNYHAGEDAAEATFDRILASLLTGESITLPDFTLNAKSQVDLARLGQAVPELLAVRQDRQLASGQLTLTSLMVKGGSAPSAAADLAIRDLAVRSTESGDTARLEAMTVVLDSVLDQGQGLNVRKLELTTGFARMSASGTPSSLKADFEAHLDRLQNELGQLFDMGQGRLAGTINGTLNADRPSDEQVNISLETQARDVQYATADTRFELAQGTLSERGHVTLADQKVVAFTLAEARADLDGEVVATAKGRYDLDRQGWSADLEVVKGNLTFLSSRAAGLGLEELARYAGNVALKASVAQSAGDKPLATTGQVIASDLQVDGEPLLEGQSTLEWSGVNLAADMSSVSVKRVDLKSKAATLTAADIQYQGGDEASLQGEVNGAGDLATCLQTLARIGKWESTPAIAGHLTLSTTGRTQGKAIELVGTSQIDGFAVGVGEGTTRPEKVTLAYGINLDSEAGTLRVQQCRLDSQPLALELTGSINEYATRKVLDLKGRYQASWPELTAVMHELAPATKDILSFAGKTGSAFSVKGPASQPDATPAFRGVTTGLDLGWESASAYDVRLGQATLSPRLENGNLTLPEAAIPASQGHLRLRADVDFAPDEPQLTVPGTLALLDNVAVTDELSRSVLSRINPIFLHMARVEGLVQLRLQDLDVPLGESIKTIGSGRGHMDLSDMKMGPTGMLAELLALGGLSGDGIHPVKVSGVDLVLKDGRIMYDNLQMVFPGDFDLIFRGSVGFDDTLDLVVSIPVRPELLERFKVKAPVVDVAKLLADLRVDIPIAGTREQPKLDFSKVDVKALLAGVIKQDAGKSAVDTATGILQRLRPEKKDE